MLTETQNETSSNESSSYPPFLQGNTVVHKGRPFPGIIHTVREDAHQKNGEWWIFLETGEDSHPAGSFDLVPLPS